MYRLIFDTDTPKSIRTSLEVYVPFSRTCGQILSIIIRLLRLIVLLLPHREEYITYWHQKSEGIHLVLLSTLSLSPELSSLRLIGGPPFSEFARHTQTFGVRV